MTIWSMTLRHKWLYILIQTHFIDNHTKNKLKNIKSEPLMTFLTHVLYWNKNLANKSRAFLMPVIKFSSHLMLLRTYILTLSAHYTNNRKRSFRRRFYLKCLKVDLLQVEPPPLKEPEVKSVDYKYNADGSWFTLFGAWRRTAYY